MHTSKQLISTVKTLSEGLLQLSDKELNDLIKFLDFWHSKKAALADAELTRAMSELLCKALNLKEARILAAPVELTEEEALGQAMNERKTAKRRANAAAKAEADVEASK